MTLVGRLLLFYNNSFSYNYDSITNIETFHVNVKDVFKGRAEDKNGIIKHFSGPGRIFVTGTFATFQWFFVDFEVMHTYL